jgi:hypothetical protein
MIITGGTLESLILIGTGTVIDTIAAGIITIV